MPFLGVVFQKAPQTQKIQQAQNDLARQNSPEIAGDARAGDRKEDEA